jgi:hypothetical protein
MNKPGYEEEKWHTCHPLSVTENSQENQDDWISRKDKRFSASVLEKSDPQNPFFCAD